MNDYKSKYLNMRAKMMEVADVSFRLGYEQGARDSEMRQMQQQMQQQQMMQEQAMAQQAQMAGSPEEQAMMEAQQQEELPPGQEAPMSQEEEMVDVPSGPSELDEKIDELESLVAKGEKPSVVALRKAVEQIAEIRKSQKQKLTSRQQKEVSAQKNFVDSILKKWESESKDLSEDIEDIIKQHGFKIGE